MSNQIAAEDKDSLASKMQLTLIDELKIQEYGPISHSVIEYSICKECGNQRPMTTLTRDFTFAELCTATNGFCQENFLSEGGFGSVYRGRLNDGLLIAVKQYKHESSQGEREFRSEVRLLGRLRHKNVVMLQGSCSQGNHRLLVYEYVCNGSLEQHLSSKILALFSFTVNKLISPLISCMSEASIHF